ncbi:glycosyltransferase [Xanthomarina spongicola]|uniref:glycosyltransferase n=1 Tax=Xanthomarina spongicola TaxID=570520 RepID=UPI001FEA596F|nr:glycosyltransferase [Xanthomarina spongicola]
MTIISHTEHYKNSDGSIVGLGSTVTEINHLLEIFDMVIHVAMLHDSVPPPSALPYLSDKITFVALPAVGGTSINDKMAIVFKAPHILNTIRKAVEETDYFQFRAPTGIGVYVIPYLIFLSKKKGWFKYAGNWKQQNATMAYSFQRWLLKQQKRTVTINGMWNDQPKQCKTFENPCLTKDEIELGKQTIANKIFQFPLQFCFVGRLEAAKGLDLIIEAIQSLEPEELLKIGTIHLVGEGKRITEYKKKIKDINLPFEFHGFLSRIEVHDIYRKSHAIILPSASEGFPKVIAEAMNYGCVPIVSNVSSIGHYIKDNKNGFLIETLNAEGVVKVLRYFLNLHQTEYFNLVNLDNKELAKFSYAFYNQRIKDEILLSD